MLLCWMSLLITSLHVSSIGAILAVDVIGHVSSIMQFLLCWLMLLCWMSLLITSLHVSSIGAILAVDVIGLCCFVGCLC